MVRAITLLRNTLEMKVVAEGVETESQRVFCNRSAATGCRVFCSAAPNPPAKSKSCWRRNPSAEHCPRRETQVRSHSPDNSFRSPSPVLRGEGWGEGRSRVAQLAERPLTLTLSPEYRGEGTRRLRA